MNRPLSRWTLLSVVTICSFFSLGLNAQQKTIVETAVSAGKFKTLVAAVKAAGLVKTLSGHDKFTVFAPTDEAFAKLDPQVVQTLLKPENKSALTDVLTYHVLAGKISARDAYPLTSAKTVNGQRLKLDLGGKSPRVNESTLVITDIACSNGVIHVIDSVLLPAQSNLVATASGAGNFSTLLAAVDAAGLREVLEGPGPFTVFAPTNEAFAKLPKGTVENLLKPENKKQLIDILKYHVVSGRVYDDTAVQAGRAGTLLGSSIEVGFSAEGLRINESRVVAKNLETSNGLIHVIDQVLLPQKMSRRQVMTTLSGAIDRGVPIFNSGHHGRCCDIYMEAMMKIQKMGVENMDDHSMTRLTRTIEDARQTNSMTDRAWVLRRGMDDLYMRASRMSSSISGR
ncbi:MAG: fasciclin domain-containing protein [Planctomycetota bacterium]|nr:fasciclin domain-containing protein [Planctomycetota bacterium]